MPATSPEAIAKKNARKKARRAEKKFASTPPRISRESKTSPEFRRRFPAEVSLATPGERRAYLAEVFRNTVSAAP